MNYVTELLEKQPSIEVVTLPNGHPSGAPSLAAAAAVAASPSESPPVQQILVAVHGIGDQFSFETIQLVVYQFCRYFGQPSALPLGRFHSKKVEDEGAYFMQSPPDPELPANLGFAEIYWADIPRRLAKEGYSLEESRKWARTLVDRVPAPGLERSGGRPCPGLRHGRPDHRADDRHRDRGRSIGVDRRQGRSGGIQPQEPADRLPGRRPARDRVREPKEQSAGPVPQGHGFDRPGRTPRRKSTSSPTAREPSSRSWGSCKGCRPRCPPPGPGRSGGT